MIIFDDCYDGHGIFSCNPMKEVLFSNCQITEVKLG